MKGPRHSPQRDGNELEIVAALKRCGFSVVRLNQPLDLLVGKHAKTCLVEVKLPPGPAGGMGHSNLNPAQRNFVAEWKGCAHVVRSSQEAISAVQACHKRPGIGR